MINVAYLTLDDKDGNPVQFHRTLRRSVHRASGLVGLPPVRSSTRPRPTRHGVIDQSKWVDGALVVLDGRVTAAEAGGHDAINELHQLMSPLMDTLEQGPSLLKWQEGTTGRELQRLVKLTGSPDAQLDATSPLIPYQVQLRSEDYRAYSQQLVSSASGLMSDTGGGWIFPDPFPVQFTAGGAGIASFQNDGNVSTPPVFRLYGQLVDPRVKLEPAGPELVFTGTVGPSDYLEVDVGGRSVTLNGDAAINRLHFVNFAASTWFDLPRGQGVVRLLATSATSNAHMTIEYRHAYA